MTRLNVWQPSLWLGFIKQAVLVDDRFLDFYEPYDLHSFLYPIPSGTYIV